MAVVEQPKNISETLPKLIVISKTLEDNLHKIHLKIIYLKSISDQDTSSLNSFLLSFNSDEYTKFINSLNITEVCPEELQTYVTTTLTTLLTGSLEQINLKIQNLNDLIDQDVRIILKRCYLEYKIDHYILTQQELYKIQKSIQNVKHDYTLVIPNDFNNVLDLYLKEITLN